MIACLPDDSSVLALGKGYPALSAFIVDAAAGRALLSVPALCLCSAEAKRPGRVVLSVDAARYQGTGIEPIDPGLAG